MRLQVHVTSLHKNESFILELKVPPGVITWVHSRFNLKRFAASALNSMATYVHYSTKAQVGGFIVGY